MKAVTLRTHGGPEVLTVEDLPTPEPGPREVRVRVRATAMNRLDVWVRRGLPNMKLAYPHILGCDVAGVVDALGPGAKATVGDRVIVSPGLSCGRCEMCWSGRDNLCREYKILGEHVRGGYAEYVVVPDANLLTMPARLSFEQASAVPLVFLTAWQMLVRRAELRPGQTVLVLASGSGVGSAGVQIAKLYGATVIATASTDEKLARAKALGADHTVKTDDFLPAVRELTGKRGVDVVFEHVGEATWERSIQALAWGGRLVTCGATSGWNAKTDLRHVFYRQIQILGSTMGPKGDLFEIVRHVEAGRLSPVVDVTMPLEQAADAHRRLETNEGFGKIVLTVG